MTTNSSSTKKSDGSVVPLCKRLCFDNGATLNTNNFHTLSSLCNRAGIDIYQGSVALTEPDISYCKMSGQLSLGTGSSHCNDSTNLFENLKHPESGRILYVPTHMQTSPVQPLVASCSYKPTSDIIVQRDQKHINKVHCASMSENHMSLQRLNIDKRSPCFKEKNRPKNNPAPQNLCPSPKKKIKREDAKNEVQMFRALTLPSDPDPPVLILNPDMYTASMDTMHVANSNVTSLRLTQPSEKKIEQNQGHSYIEPTRTNDVMKKHTTVGSQASGNIVVKVFMLPTSTQVSRNFFQSETKSLSTEVLLLKTVVTDTAIKKTRSVQVETESNPTQLMKTGIRLTSISSANMKSQAVGTPAFVRTFTYTESTSTSGLKLSVDTGISNNNLIEKKSICAETSTLLLTDNKGDEPVRTNGKLISMSSSRNHGGHRAYCTLSFEKANQMKDRYPKYTVIGINTEMQKDSQSFGQTTSFTVLPGLNKNSTNKFESSFAVQNTMDVYAQYAQKFIRGEHNCSTIFSANTDTIYSSTTETDTSYTVRSSRNDNCLSISEATFNFAKRTKVDTTSQYNYGSVKKIDVANQCSSYKVQKVDIMCQCNENQGQFIDFTQYIGFQDQVNNIKIHSVHPEYKAELYSDRYGQNNRSTSNHYKNRQNIISENNANPYILYNTHLKGRYDLSGGCRSRYSRRREQKVDNTNQYSENNKDKLENTKKYCDRQEQMIRSSHYQKGCSRQKANTSLYRYYVCRDHAKYKCDYRNAAESVLKRRSVCTITSQKTLVSTALSKIVIAIPTIYKGSRKLKLDTQIVSSETASISTETNPTTLLQDNPLPLLGTKSIVDVNIQYSTHRFPDGTYTSRSATGNQSELMTVFTLCSSVREVAVQEPSDQSDKSVMLDTQLISLMKPKSTSCLPFVMLPERPFSPPMRKPAQQETLRQSMLPEDDQTTNRIRRHPLGNQILCGNCDSICPILVSHETNTEIRRLVNRSVGDTKQYRELKSNEINTFGNKVTKADRDSQLPSDVPRTTPKMMDNAATDTNSQKVATYATVQSTNCKMIHRLSTLARLLSQGNKTAGDGKHSDAVQLSSSLNAEKWLQRSFPMDEKDYQSMFDTEQMMDLEHTSPTESLCIPYKLTKCSNIVSGEVETSKNPGFTPLPDRIMMAVSRESLKDILPKGPHRIHALERVHNERLTCTIGTKMSRGQRMVDKCTSDTMTPKRFEELELQTSPEVCHTAVNMGSSKKLLESNSICLKQFKSTYTYTSRCFLPPLRCSQDRYGTDCVFVYQRPRCLTHYNSLMDVSVQKDNCHKQSMHKQKCEEIDNLRITSWSSNASPESRGPSAPRHISNNTKEILPKVYETSCDTAEPIPAHPTKLMEPKSYRSTAQGEKDLCQTSAMVLTPPYNYVSMQHCCVCNKKRNKTATTSTERQSTVSTYTSHHECPVRYCHTATQDSSSSFVGSKYPMQFCPACQTHLIEIVHSDETTYSGETGIQSVEECIKTNFMESCRYYSHMLTKHISKVRHNLARQLQDRIPATSYPPVSMDRFLYQVFTDLRTEACTMKPSGKGELGCQTKHATQQVLRPTASSYLNPAISLTHICNSNEVEKLQSMYYMLAAIDGRMRRLKNNIP
ncbi:uncharacterized protein LOC113236497 isoform X2 [Hyposmocoma kahamanoa]|uniref:uncharacterized protein LOC113236497 isoform X2 n=1 Tax=Hyposmocoma kahamanoa TaxID=1477025 RepID=UPI000E6D7519|nr:uncharacterized protein LOC113236497 isoform X2 [Hyposmocoma kahamanoa]